MNFRQGKQKLKGQTALELVFMGAVMVLALVAMMNYMRNAVAGRAKSGADSWSPTLANPEQMAWATTRCQEVWDIQNADGGVRSSFTETSMQVGTGQGSMGPLPECEPALPRPN